uniref:ABC transporter domain-containing protein n=1 Tax=Trichuris muris TaxID=70415 RepID=A0A5S6Q0I9_TRIMR
MQGISRPSIDKLLAVQRLKDEDNQYININTFYTQFRVLLWKNFLVRFRAKTLFVLELLLPVGFFLLLASARKEQDAITHRMCTYSPKGMPSSGLFTMLQTYFCTLPNGCINKSLPDWDLGSANKKLPLNDFIAAFRQGAQNRTVVEDTKSVLRNVATLTELSLKMKPEIKEYSPMNIQEFMDFSTEAEEFRLLPVSFKNCTLTRRFFIDALRKRIENASFHEDFCKNFFLYVNTSSVPATDTPLFRKLMCKHFPVDGIYEIFNFPKLIDVFVNLTGFRMRADELSTLANAVGSLHIHIAHFRETDALTPLINQLANYTSATPMYSSVSKKLGILSELFCGAPLSGLDEMIMEQKILEALLQMAFRADVKYTSKRTRSPFEDIVKGFEGENATQRNDTVICDSFPIGSTETACWEWLQTYQLPKELAVQVYTLLRGVILVSPASPIVEKIVEELNGKLHEIEVFRSLFVSWYQNMLNYPTAFEQSKFYNATKILALMYSNMDTAADISSILSSGQLYKQGAHYFVMEGWRNISYEELKLNMSQSYNLFNCFRPARFHVIKNEKTLEETGTCLSAYFQFFSGIVFHQLNSSSTYLPKALEYKIRMANHLMDKTIQEDDSNLNPKPRDHPFADMKYVYFGFSFLQDMVDGIITALQTNVTSQIGVIAQQFPTPCYRIEKPTKSMGNLIPSYVVLSWMLIVAMIMKSVVIEKERRVKEFMKVMGLGSFVHWFAWYVQSMAMLCGSILAIAVIVKIRKILEYTNPLCFIAFLLAYAFAIVPQAFLLTFCFKKANVAAAIGPLLFYIPDMLRASIDQHLKHMAFTEQIAGCLLPQIAFGFGCSIITYLEEKETGLQWSNMDSKVSSYELLSFDIVICMLLADGILYSVLTWCAEWVLYEQGIARNWHFPFHLSYWLGDQTSGRIRERKVFKKGERQEEINLPIGIRAIGLTKIYHSAKKTDKPSLDDLNVDFYDGQIAAVLGPNGAGKTTMMSIICGLIPPTEGTVVVYGMDILTNMPAVRRSLGFCPQHNILFDRLTVKEHLQFYSSIKGVNIQGKDEEIDSLLRDTKLMNKKNELSMNLSGGMKRKLSIAIAFIGGSKIVMLDEPTAGVDPYSRRAIWDLLLKCKRDRTIVFSTHFFDEAEILGDRIAMIGAGQLKCCGSAIFLKNYYRSGYNLTFTRAVEASTNREHILGSNQKLINFVTNYVPDVKIVRASLQEMQFMLPGKFLEDLRPLVSEIDKRLAQFECVAYGLSESSLEEIFRRELTNKATSNNETTRNIKPEQDESLGNVRQPRTAHMECYEFEVEAGFSAALLLQFKSLFRKRILNMVRQSGTFILINVLPLLLIAYACHQTKSGFSHSDHDTDHGQFLIDPVRYKNSSVSFFSFTRPPRVQDVDSVLKPYVKSMIKYGLGNRCHKQHKKWFRYSDCGPESPWLYDYPTDSIMENNSFACYCGESMEMTCKMQYHENSPRRYVARSSDIMVDLTEMNITEWLLMTAKHYRKRRYGGYSVAKPPEVYVNVKIEDLEENVEILYTELISFFNRTDVNLDTLQKHGTKWPVLNSKILAKLLDEMTPKHNVKVWYNNQGWASLSAYMSAFSNARLRAHLPSNESAEEYSIAVINHPMKTILKETSNLVKSIVSMMSEMLTSICVLLAFCTVIGSFCLFAVEDRVSDSKHQQFVSGLHRWLYWVANFSFDMIIYIFITALALLIFAIFDEKPYVGSASAALAITTIFIAFGLSMIPYVYVLSFLFQTSSTAALAIGGAHFIIAFAASTAMTICEILEEAAKDLSWKCNTMKNIFVFFPPYVMAVVWSKIRITFNIYSSKGKELGTDYYADLMRWNALGKPVTIMVAEAIGFFLLLLMFEYKHEWFNLGKYLTALKKESPCNADYDENVAAERQRVLAGVNKNSALKIINLTKVYYKFPSFRTFTAVDDVCFEVLPGECFGLLGHNGAGKTTTFKMITQRISISKGRVIFSCPTMNKAIQRSTIGYCPQFDALDGNLTARETLFLYAGIRCIKETYHERIVDAYLKRFGLEGHANKRVKTYSGGLKRRLSTAIALLGNSPLILLDEPTAGMDPESRRFLWDVILERISAGQSILFTSNSMEECEILCTRVGILAHGRFTCLDTAQALKNKFGLGYQVAVKLKSNYESQLPDLVKFVQKRLPKSSLVEQHLNLAKFRLRSNLKWMPVL